MSKTDRYLQHLPPTLISALSTPRPTLTTVKLTHALLIVSGGAARKPVIRHLLALCLRPQPPHLSYALALHPHLPSPDPIGSNLLLISLSRRFSPHHLLSFFTNSLHRNSIHPGRRSFPLLVTAAKLLPSLHLGESLHSLALRLNFLTHIEIPNSLLHMYASCDALDDARQLFDEMPVRDRVSYNSLIDGYIQSGDLAKAEALFLEMPDKNVVSWSTIINGFVRNRMFDRGVDLFRQMQELGFEPKDATMVGLLRVYSHFKMRIHGRSVHGFVMRRWLCVPTHVNSALVDCYCKCGLLDSATALFEGMENKDLICWNTMISGLGSQGKGEEAIQVFMKLLQERMRPDDITFIGVLVGCGHSGLVEEGTVIFKRMMSEFRIKPSFAHYWCLIDLFVRAGRPLDALKVIQGMPLDRKSALWGAVIWLAKVQGDVSVGEHLGKRMIELEPDNSRRYVPLANLYAAASRWDKYKELQNEMKERGLKKLPDCTLIDLNVIAHKFSVGDESLPEIKKMYEVLEKVKDLLKLQPCGPTKNEGEA